MQARGWAYQTEHLGLEFLANLVKYFSAFTQGLRERRVPLLELDSEVLDFRATAGRAEALRQVQEFIARRN
jgi:hypothetical protein